MTRAPGRPAAADSLRDRTLRGLGWSIASQVLRLALQAATSILLARLLTPDDFGLLAMVMVFTGFASTISDLGLNAALIQKKEIEPRHPSTILVVQLAFAGILTLLLAAGAPLIARFFQEPRLSDVCIGIAPVFLIGALGGVPTALLLRRMAFRSIALIETISILSSGTAAVLLAMNGWGIWSLVSQSLLAAAIHSALSLRRSRWRLSLSFSRPAWRDLRSFSSALTGYNLANYWVRNLDNLIVGKFLGPVSLGLYNRAYSLMLFPVKQIGGSISRVMFPAMSSIQDQTQRLRHVYLRATRMIALITFPLMAGMSILSDLFIATLFGPKWQSAGAILRILALVGMLQSVGSSLGWVYQARGRTDVMFRVGLLTGAVYAVAFIVGLRWGVLGVASAYAASNVLLLWFPTWKIAGRLIGMTFRRMTTNLAGVFACTAAMAAIVLILRHFVFLRPGLISLMALTVAGGGVYMALAHWTRLPAYLDIIQLVKEWFNGKSAQSGLGCDSHEVMP